MTQTHAYCIKCETRVYKMAIMFNSNPKLSEKLRKGNLCWLRCLQWVNQGINDKAKEVGLRSENDKKNVVYIGEEMRGKRTSKLVKVASGTWSW